ncbi:Peptidoglycan/LPS O-acetylase OafA/YrhL, contains acyltransferase and SGNH-hydrolase domains [Polynucleobacter meluiroseus]|uniref:Peptidoglycan/LPS O-acetylase OafA/YrhL, contains acyltransferase and SGNH-hydrolase domains n=1 Tax=Polynucleobacter meluiroseus TaxID=1938814 RepID=A0A240E1J1_9BURK|nr:acyltransferase [Polynucleobacter meluiroseus]SNX29133.1 Peptidoglycan/LPS O-acetylase OafA/YrhL, contains acyltransferase and SGNH-hydrolase domains [Polynucleobacter meluiroseus]
MRSKNHFLLVDFLKVFAALVIILHHLSSYGQIAEDVHLLLPEIMTWLFEYGRYAVQIFLVMGGYLAAQSLTGMNHLHGLKAVSGVVINRYLRLLMPYVASLMITVCCAWIARFWVQDEFVGESETLMQFLAHLFFLQGILGLDSISAGVWYVAIDWQLYAMLAIVLGIFPRSRSLVWILSAITVASLLYFNRHGEFENYFIYFMGPYGLGILAQLAKNYPDPRINRFAKIVIALVGVVILVNSFPTLWLRNILAYGVAVALIQWGSRAYKDNKHAKAHFAVNAILWGSRRSYCAFLLHFSFILLANTLYIAWGINQRHDGVIALGMMLSALALSWLAANYLYRWVEVPTRKLKI